MNILKVLTPSRKTGNFGERAAARLLKKSGYKILARNFTALDREIDVIARSKDVTVFVEVKTRTVGKQSPAEPRPASAVTPDKQRDIIKAAKCYLAQKKPEGRVRFDIIEVLLTGEEKKSIFKINHIENAFNQNTANRRH